MAFFIGGDVVKVVRRLLPALMILLFIFITALVLGKFVLPKTKKSLPEMEIITLPTDAKKLVPLGYADSPGESDCFVQEYWIVLKRIPKEPLILEVSLSKINSKEEGLEMLDFFLDEKKIEIGDLIQYRDLFINEKQVKIILRVHLREPQEAKTYAYISGKNIPFKLNFKLKRTNE